MDRETKQFTRNSYSFELKTWLTANEQRLIENSTYDGLKLKKEELEQTLSGELIAKMTQNAENATIKQYVVSFNDSNENILERILESKSEILKDILAEISKISDDEEQVKKN